MFFTSDNSEDIKKYYLQTYIKIKEQGDSLFYIQRVDRGSVQGMTEEGGEFIIYLDNENPYEIDYVLPHKSFFQYEKDAYQLYRTPAKQYQRGLNGANTKVARLNQAGESEQIGEGTLDFKLLKAFVTKQPFFTLSQAIAKSNPNGLRSFVLAPRLMYHRATKGLYMDLIRIGQVNHETREIVMVQPVFSAEVYDFLKQTHEQETFKVTHAA